MKSEHSLEVSSGNRFEFGANWLDFLGRFDSDRLIAAEKSLRRMLGKEHLQGCDFIDVGCGSGLFSLAARKMGASVHSLDFDPASVRCTRLLKEKVCAGDELWKIEEASILHPPQTLSSTQFDIVYSWGVLHHTGRMWQAIENTATLVKPGGTLFISIYNDQGFFSRAWKRIKRVYCLAPQIMKNMMVLGFGTYYESKALASRVLRQGKLFRSHDELLRRRGMSIWNDVRDFVGGYPFEVAKPEEIFDFLRERGFELVKLKTCGGGLSCNEFVFVKSRVNKS
jgi:2-polyprenyl-3-methyl-5-hydroxy-6-metoxy-1,4-benzoquinol methylase